MADYWLKLYIEILDDPKMATLPDRVWRRVIELFLCAKKLNKDGHLPDTRQLAWMLRMNADELEMDMAQIAHTGIVVREVNGWFIPRFQERQAAVPAVERKRQERSREQSQQYYGDVTDLSRNVTQSREQKTEDREQKTEAETEQNALAPFDIFQRIVERAGINLSGAADIKALQSIVAMGANEDDLRAGIAWKSEHSTGPLRWVSSVVEPTRTAMQMRLKTNGANKVNGTVYTDAHGNQRIM